MICNYKILGTIPGQYAVGSHSIANKTLIEVCREGTNYDIKKGIPSTITTRQVNYLASFGILKFDSAATFNPGETVYVKFKV